MAILIEKQTPAGIVRMTSEPVFTGRGRIASAELIITCADKVLWKGPDTPPAALIWRPLLDAALAAEEEPTKKTTPQKRGKDSNGHV
uniref:Uncharacterized protein n=1 Tax=viral metagenome TaxID=1070528 RepID=A0A6M3L9U6_9ZZZZ